jgi:N-dimethylarginine dimethylaminohydrolase
MSSAATFGGPGWIQREGTHADDVAGNAVWRRCGVCCEGHRLQAVLIAWPGDELLAKGVPDEHLFLGPVSTDVMRAQALGIVRRFQAHGVTVHVHRPKRRPPANFVFLRDLFFMTPEGAVLARTAARQRAGEERVAAEALARLGIPILASPRGAATLEGADVLWLRPDRVLVGVGRRTNELGFQFVRDTLRAFGVDTIPIPMPSGVQHLLGIVNFLDARLALVRRDKAPEELWARLKASDIATVPLEPGPEVVERRALGFVGLGERRVLMPSGCPATRSLIESHGLAVDEVDIGEYIQAAGSLACLTGVLHRSVQ